MAFSLPNPNIPTNGQALDATPVLANFVAIADAIQNLDAAGILPGSLTADAFNASINPNTLLNETTSPFVYTGCVWTPVTGFGATMTAGTIYFNGLRVSVNGLASHTFSASSDTYVDIDVNGNVAYPSISNGGTTPSLTVNSVRVAKVVTSGSAITSITTSGSDSIGNLIYPVGAASTAHLQNPAKFFVYRAAAANSTNNAQAVIAMDTKVFDSGNNVDIVTNKGRFTATVAGFYWFSARFDTNGGNRSFASIFKNGTEAIRGTDTQGTGVIIGSEVSGILQLAAGDYAEPYLFTASSQALGVGQATVYFQGNLISAS